MGFHVTKSTKRDIISIFQELLTLSVSIDTVKHTSLIDKNINCQINNWFFISNKIQNLELIKRIRTTRPYSFDRFQN